MFKYHVWGLLSGYIGVSRVGVEHWFCGYPNQWAIVWILIRTLEMYVLEEYWTIVHAKVGVWIRHVYLTNVCICKPCSAKPCPIYSKLSIFQNFNLKKNVPWFRVEYVHQPRHVTFLSLVRMLPFYSSLKNKFPRISILDSMQ
jgi:hypothetical protein